MYRSTTNYRAYYVWIGLSFSLATLKELKDQLNVVAAHLFKAVRLGYFFKV